MLAPASAGTQDFSLVLGGPLYQVFRRAHLSGPVLEQLGRRIWVLTLVAWLPLLLLTLASGQAWGSPSALPFLRDIEAQVRLLVALPVLIAAELVVQLTGRPGRQRPIPRISVGDHRGRPDRAARIRRPPGGGRAQPRGRTSRQT